jgi:hypothetical protein
MKVIQPFFLGGAGGLVLTLAIVIGFYVSPLRKSLYLDWDPEITGLRDKLEGLREKLQKDEMAIAGMASGSASSDSLKAAQAGSWKEYRHWRNRLGNLSRMHEHAHPGGFTAWAYSLRYWFVPAAAVMALFPGLLLAVRGARRPRPSKPMRAAPRAPNSAVARKEAMASFESAVKQVARIATPATVPPAPVPETVAMREAANRGTQVGRKTEYLPQGLRMPEFPQPAPALPGQPEAEVLRPLPMESPETESSPYEVPSGNVFRESETPERPFLEESGVSARPEGLETQFIQLGPGGWGDARKSPLQDNPPAAPPAPAGQGLSMEDEDGESGSPAQDPPTGQFPPGHLPGGQENGGAQNQFMPPTTEVERVERRKAEVLKLARKGLTSSEISRRLRISQDQVEFIIRLRREKG